MTFFNSSAEYTYRAHFFPSSGSFFDGFFEWDALKLLFFVFHIILTFIGPCLLYSIVWYERFSPDLRYRTLMNQLLTQICIFSTFDCLILRLVHLSCFVIGPYSSWTSGILISIARFTFICRLMQLTIRQLIKYLYIFQWKYLVSLNDDFFAIYFTHCNILFSFLFIFTNYFLGFNNSEVDYHLCSGKNPKDNILEDFIRMKKYVKSNELPLSFDAMSRRDPLAKLTQILFLVIFVVVVQTLFYSKKEILNSIWNRKNVIVQNETIHQARKNIKFEETKHVILGEGGTLTFFFAITLAYIPFFITKSLLNKDPNVFNKNSGKLWYYGSKLSLAIMSNCIPPLIIIVGNSKMRLTLKREIAYFLVGLKDRFKG
jgi:hypothetical protein